LSSFYKGVDLVSVTEFLQGFSDLEVLELANRKNRAILTFDKDFGEMVVREKAKVKGLILLRFAPRTPEQIAARVWQILTSQFPGGKQPARREGEHYPDN
jgi:predicted nuclease of predicted toxin-antitoxin system